ncbi:PLP-dependent aminotransferase family protein [Roseimaritima ulvae]|uniref:L-seryl-tRNA(Sec) selenium transferase n=1 Tax=Roseimaritima ulvae TaxID=980254 RepID=A0A5B9QMP6_9BACT|nr:hypothetical protein [Roseimaritima ulvae]QEG38286.1 L-seryl-tRNA(Sec) selenium transferase [Roseimaritima ulvae]
MAIPDWAVEQLKRQLNDVASQLKNPEAVQQLRDRATEFLHELPQTAKGVWQQAREGVQPGRTRSQVSPMGAAVINATGAFCGGPIGGVPLAAAAVDAGVESLTSFRTALQDSPDWFQREASRVAKRIGCERLLAASHVESALLVLADVAKKRQAKVFVPRCCAVGLGDGMSLPDLLTVAGAEVREIGSSEGLNAADWRRAAAGANDILVVSGDPKQLELPPADVECLLVSVVTWGTVEPLGPSVTPLPPTFGDLLKGACDVVITSAAGLLGGPECGLVMGDRQAVGEIAASPLWSIVEAPASTQAMLVAALEQPSPLAGLLETSIENLRHRADNLATRLAAAGEGEDEGGSIKQCLLTDYPARLAVGAPYEVSSRQLRLRHASLSAQQWAAKLIEQSPAILAKVEDDVLVVDLRWVDVSQDSALALGLTGS